MGDTPHSIAHIPSDDGARYATSTDGATRPTLVRRDTVHCGESLVVNQVQVEPVYRPAVVARPLNGTSTQVAGDAVCEPRTIV